MDRLYASMGKALNHLRSFHEVFKEGNNFTLEEQLDFQMYNSSYQKMSNLIGDLEIDKQLYSPKGRQMILADFLEYCLLGRGYYALKNKEDKSKFIKLVMYLVNVLMSYEVLTVSENLRHRVLDSLKNAIQGLVDEELFKELDSFKGKVGLKDGESDASKELDRYFDSLLPKTAGGLWHELLVYVFLLKQDVGYIIPLLLSQRLLSLNENLVPPDFLLLTHDKNIYGIEVGIKKEIQSGSFSLTSNIPTATIDTINSRCSDRCPICKRWIPFCDFVIDSYSDLGQELLSSEVRCLEQCTLFDKADIAQGKCNFTKYSRSQARTYNYTHHAYANGLHYHYGCVLRMLEPALRSIVVESNDSIALKTHYPYYSGIEALLKW